MTTATPAAPASTSTVWTIDAAHTDVAFAARHMMVTTVRGKFQELEGELRLDEARPENSGGELRIAAASISSGMAARDNHLRSADFFDAEQFPTIVFRATRIDPIGGSEYRLTGDLTIRDTSLPITFDVTHLGWFTGMDGSRRVGLSGRTRLRRKDWGLGWNVALETGGWLVSEEIDVEFDVAAVEVRAEAPEVPTADAAA